MTLSTNIQEVKFATSTSHDAGEFCEAFDSVTVYSEAGGYVCIFLPSGKGQAVADVINAALVPDAFPVMEASDA